MVRAEGAEIGDGRPSRVEGSARSSLAARVTPKTECDEGRWAAHHVSTFLPMCQLGGVGLTLMAATMLAACGSANTSKSPGSPAALARIRGAVLRTESAGSAHFVTTSDTSATFVQGSATKTQSDHIAVVGDLRFPGPDVSLTSDVRTGVSSASPPVKQIDIGTTTYLNTSPSTSSWVRGTLHHPYPYLGAVETKVLETTEGPVSTAGTRAVGGQSTTEYLVAVPASTSKTELTNSKNQPYDVEIKTAPFVLSVWLDRAGRIVRTQATMTVTQSRSAGSAVQSITTTLSDFGEAVQIVAPATSIGPFTSTSSGS